MKKSPVSFDNLIPKLPPMIARDHVEKILGGVISGKRLANLDCEGRGPNRMRIGRKIVYYTDELLEWLAKRAVDLN